MNQPASTGVLAAGFVFLLASTISSQTPVYVFHGNAANDEFGRSVSGAGDVNADGYDDVIVGAYLDDRLATNAGSARVLSGRDGSVLYDIDGNSQGDRFGFAVSGAGDVNGDGHADFIVGAFRDDPNGSDSGSAVVFSGADGSVLYRFDGDGPGDQFGISVSDAGDVNADGYADVIIGARYDDDNGTDSGSARVFSGRDGTVIYTFLGASAGARFGQAVSGARDVNHDGHDDVIIGAPLDDHNGTDTGSARVFSGATGTVIHVFGGQATGDGFGGSVAGPGRVDLDLTPDLLVGARRNDANGTDSGKAYLFSGTNGTPISEFAGDGAGDELGSVSGLGDVDGDGYDDFAIGAWRDDNTGAGSGMVRVYSGLTGLLYQIDGNAAGDHLGLSVHSAGDVNGDGYGELIAGAHQTDVNGMTNAGAALVFSLAPYDRHEAQDPVHFIDPTARFGSAVAAAGDVNGDGFGDFIVGAPFNDTNGMDAGSVVVISGRDRQMLHSLVGGLPGDRFGTAVCGVGDVNGDGLDDFAVGSPGLDGVSVSDVGEVTWYSGADGALILRSFGNIAGARFGSAVDNAGDVNGDGHDDLIVGAPQVGTQTGFAKVLSGADLVTTLHLVNGRGLGGQFGASVSGVGDVDGDGYDDFAVGAPQRSLIPAGSGYVRVYSGRTGAILHDGVWNSNFHGNASGDSFGHSVDGAGDFNGDGYDDIVVGAYSEDVMGVPNSGAAYVLDGQTGNIILTKIGRFSDNHMGFAVAGVGDANGDGLDDVIVGAPTTRVYLPGVVHLLWGGSLTGSSSTDFRGVLDTEFGFSVSGAGDVNGDGFADFVVGTPGDDTLSPDSGGFVLYESRTDRSRFWTFGSACPTTQGKLPRIGHSGRPALGSSFSIKLRLAPVLSLAILVIGLDQRATDLTPLGLTGCVGLTDPAFAGFYLTSATGTAEHQQQLLSNPGILGIQAYFQWLAVNPGVNPAGLVTSNGLRATIGIR